MTGQIAVDGLALGSGGAALGRRNLLAPLGELLVIVRAEAAVAEPQPADQPAMHQQVGVSADRRREVGVARQAEAEMPGIARRGVRLRLQIGRASCRERVWQYV